MATRAQHGTLRHEDETDVKDPFQYALPVQSYLKKKAPAKAEPIPNVHYLNPKATLLNPYPEWCSFLQVRRHLCIRAHVAL